VVDVLERPDLMTDERFANRRARSANKDALRRIHWRGFARTCAKNWMAKMKKVNVPVGYLRTVEEGFNAPEMCAATAIASAGSPAPDRRFGPQYRIPLSMSLTPIIDPGGSPLLGQQQ